MNVNLLMNLLNEILNYVKSENGTDLDRIMNSLRNEDVNIQDVINQLSETLEYRIYKSNNDYRDFNEEEVFYNEDIKPCSFKDNVDYYQYIENDNEYEERWGGQSKPHEYNHEECDFSQYDYGQNIIDTEYTPTKEYKAKYNLCTLAGKGYLIKILTLYKSLKRNSKDFKLWICCMDEVVYGALSKIKLRNAEIYKLEEIETAELLNAKKDRTVSEYCWTLKAPMMEYLLDKHQLDRIVYCDSDIYFFSNTSKIFQEWADKSVFLCPQRDRNSIEKKYGIYQAGLIGFKNDIEGRKALEWWKNKCIEWCYKIEDTENERWADQKYLDKFPELFTDVLITNNLGINAAPWNLIYNNNFNIENLNNSIYIEKNKLVAFHFACLSIFNKDEFDLWNLGRLDIPSIIKKDIYAVYIKDLRNTIDRLNEKINGLEKHIYSDNSKDEAKNFYKLNKVREYMNEYDDYYIFCTLTTKKYLAKALTLYRSLKKRINNFQLFICCVDATSYRILRKIKSENITLIKLSEIEKYNTQLNSIKKSRNETEYCWTLKAPLIKYVMEKYGVQSVVYLDADQFFFQNPKPIFDKWKDYSILMCTQRGDAELENIHGYYQAGLLGFRRDNYGSPCLEWWKNKCFEWCHEKRDENGDRWGDQKYLERLPEKFKSIKVVKDIGINAAPWNVVFNNNFNISNKNNDIYIEDEKLIVYHFGSLLIYKNGEFDLWKLNPLDFRKEVIEYIYKPYLKEINKTIGILIKHGVNIDDIVSEKINPQNLIKLD
ncbi:glycosyltransferase family protein [Clostridium sp. DL1XJH146]